jgi:bifunctional DNA-binding transcriptional regulator/antitoxin component of YhaV-PrlF toxin-antitoxin module
MDKIEKWTLPIEVNEEGEQIVTLPEDLLDTIGWNQGDELEWVVDDRGIILRKNETD